MQTLSMATIPGRIIVRVEHVSKRHCRGLPLHVGISSIRVKQVLRRCLSKRCTWRIRSVSRSCRWSCWYVFTSRAIVRYSVGHALIAHVLSLVINWSRHTSRRRAKLIPIASTARIVIIMSISTSRTCGWCSSLFVNSLGRCTTRSCVLVRRTVSVISSMAIVTGATVKIYGSHLVAHIIVVIVHSLYAMVRWPVPSSSLRWRGSSGI